MQLPELTPRQWVGQAAVWLALAAFVGVFSDSPASQVLAPDMTVLKLAVRHSGVTIGECEVRSVEELQALPPNMRRPAVCPREKSPLRVELQVDGSLVYEELIQPSGLQNDGVLAAYRRFAVPARDVAISLRVQPDMHGGAVEEYADSYRLSPTSTLVMTYTDAGFDAYQPNPMPLRVHGRN